MTTTNVPRVHLADYTSGSAADRARFVREVGDALCRVGFFTMGGHNLDPGTTGRAYDLFRDFFDLEEPVKRKYDTVAGGARGYTPFGREHAKYTTVPDLKEFWHIGQELPGGHPFRSEYPDNIWPAELPDLKPVALATYRALEESARRVLTALAEYFELPAATFADMMQDGNSVLRVIHYPPLSPEAPEGAVRAAAHEDINLITMLIESRGGGLEILTQDDRWVPVNALAGDIIVDSGDMLSRLTNGVVPSTTHRVVNPPQGDNTSRYSMPFFVHPYSDCDLTVMDRFTDEMNPPRFEPITAGAYLRERLAEIGLLEK